MERRPTLSELQQDLSQTKERAAYALQRIKELEAAIGNRNSLDDEAYVDQVQAHLRTRLASVSSDNAWSSPRWVEIGFLSLRAQLNADGNVVILTCPNGYWSCRDIDEKISEFPVGTTMDKVDEILRSLIEAVFNAMSNRLEEDSRALTEKRKSVMSVFES